MAETREQLNQNEEKKRELSERAGIMERDKSELSRQYTELEQERTQFEREMKYRTDQWESVRNKDREGLERLKLQSVKAQAEIEVNYPYRPYFALNFKMILVRPKRD